MRQSILFDPDLIRRFDVPGPRYTSYPTADRFHDQGDAADLLGRLGECAKARASLSLYFHLPFCNTVCYYCACNKLVTKDRSVVEPYLAALEQEMLLVSAHLGDAPPVSQIHWGGGTPTFLQSGEISRLMQAVRSRFRLEECGEYSIEIDPRKVSTETVAQLANEGFNRMSIGIQDFSLEVQQAVNRIQSIEETALVMDAARANGFRSISVDLIYGLPRQNKESFEKTLEIVLSLQPDRLSLYNYAHLPTRFMPQRRIAEADLPAPEEKLEILAMAIEKLLAAGYVFIGMDHFARPDDELAIAQAHGSLQRNFQGYSTHAECDMLGFGVSSIGKIRGLFVQNQRDFDGYYRALGEGRIPVMRSWAMSEDDCLRAEIIQALMCHFKLSIPELEAKYRLVFREVFAAEIVELEGLADAGLLEMDSGAIIVTMRGRMLVRVVAMVFDRYLRQTREAKRYSRVI